MDRTLQHTASASPVTRTRGSWLLRVIASLSLWQQNARTRRQLAQLDARLLADAGINPAERLAELDKPFWR